MDVINTDYFSTIQYNTKTLKTNVINLAAEDGFGNGQVKFSLAVATGGVDDSEDKNPVFGVGECITYIIGITNLSSTDLTGIKAPITGWNFVTAIPIKFTLPTGLRLKDFTHASVPELSESPYVIYTENGVDTHLKRIINNSIYSNTELYYNIIDNNCTILLPKISANSTAYITFIANAKDTLTLGDNFSMSASLNFKENPDAENTPITTDEVSVQFAYANLSAEKTSPVAVHYDEDFSYEIVLINTGNLNANITKISDLLPNNFTVSKGDDSTYKIAVKRNNTALVKDSDFQYTVSSTSLEITPVADGKLDLKGNETLTTTITGKLSKS